MEMRDKDHLKTVLFCIGIACVICLFILIESQKLRNKDDVLMNRADYLISRSEQIMERKLWY